MTTNAADRLGRAMARALDAGTSLSPEQSSRLAFARELALSRCATRHAAPHSDRRAAKGLGWFAWAPAGAFAVLALSLLSCIVLVDVSSDTLSGSDVAYHVRADDVSEWLDYLTQLGDTQ